MLNLFGFARIAVIAFGATLVPTLAAAQFEVGGVFDCPLGECDANTSDEGGDHHGISLEDHRAEARASGNGAAQRSAFAEVGVRFRPCFSGTTTIGMSDIHVVGRLRGFGGGPVIRGEVDVRTILRDITNDVELANDVIFEREERGTAGTTVNRNIDRTLEQEITATLTAGVTYDFVVRVNARKFGLNGMSDFQQGGREVTFEEVTIVPDLDDTDGDGLPDQWEVAGIDQDCDGTPDLDLPGMGADPTIKDIFVELDWMIGEEPTQAAVAAVVQSFALAPANAGGVSTPGEGINLWVDTGDLTDPTASEDGAGANTCGDGIDNGGGDGPDQFDTDCLVGALAFSSLPGGGNLGGGNGFPVGGVPDLFVDSDDDGETDFAEAKFDPARGNFDPIRAQVFRYGINAVAGGPPPNMGGQARGNDMLLFNQNAGLLMHEIGHTLDLGHGGPSVDGPSTNDVNCKPNYVSVMNYRFQGGIMVAGGMPNGQDIDGDGTGDGFILDFSPPRFAGGRGFAPLADIDETAWDETVIQDGSDPANFSAWTLNNQALVTGRLDAAPDWDGDGNPGAQQAPPAIDFNTAFWNPAASEGGAGPNTCGDMMDNDGNGAVDAADASCIGNTRCGNASNAGVQQYSGADDWSNVVLDPNRNAFADEGDIPGWNEEPSAQSIDFVVASMQTTDLAVVSKTADPDPVVAGQPVDFTITVENRGGNATTNVQVTDVLDARLHFVGGAPECSASGQEVTCSLGGLAPGETREAVINARVSVDVVCAPDAQFATLTNVAEVVNAGSYDTDPSNNTGRATVDVLCARFEYAAKYICGGHDAPEDPRLVPGQFRTTVNVHNPNDERVTFFKKIALSFPPERQLAGKVVPIGLDELDYDEALKADCSEARALIGQEGYVEGYLIVQSPLSLDVDAVYTTQVTQKEGGISTSIDVEEISERERKEGPRPDLVVLPANPEPPIDPQFDIQLPEGVPNALYCGDNGPSGGPARTVEAIVRNIGMGDAGPSTLRISFAGSATIDTVIPALPAGSDMDVSVNIPRECYGPGSCAFELTADHGDMLIEQDESNNDDESLCLSPAG